MIYLLSSRGRDLFLPPFLPHVLFVKHRYQGSPQPARLSSGKFSFHWWDSLLPPFLSPSSAHPFPKFLSDQPEHRLIFFFCGYRSGVTGPRFSAGRRRQHSPRAISECFQRSFPSALFSVQVQCFRSIHFAGPPLYTYPLLDGALGFFSRLS